MLEHIAAKLTFGDRINPVERELGAQLMFERKLKRFALRRLRTLLRFTLQAVDMCEKTPDLLVTALYLQIELGLGHELLRSRLLLLLDKSASAACGGQGHRQNVAVTDPSVVVSPLLPKRKEEERCSAAEEKDGHITPKWVL